MVKEINSDIFKAPIDILVHQANCFCTMGSGLAEEIKKRYSKAYEVDLLTTRGDYGKLGTYTVAQLEGPYLKYIVNLYSQYDYGRDKRHTDYGAFYNGIESLRDSLIKKGKQNLRIGFPHGIGCGLAGGNWAIIKLMIEDVFKNYPTDVLICKL